MTTDERLSALEREVQELKKPTDPVSVANRRVFDKIHKFVKRLGKPDKTFVPTIDV